eukprot:6470641-Prymnesium_polylepis.2
MTPPGPGLPGRGAPSAAFSAAFWLFRLGSSGASIALALTCTSYAVSISLSTARRHARAHPSGAALRRKLERCALPEGAAPKGILRGRRVEA